MRRVLPVFIGFLVLHGILRWGLDLRDMPGAAGTEVLYKAALGERKENYTVWILLLLQYNLSISVLQSAKLCSLLGGLCSVWGIYLAGKAISERTGLYSALLCISWSMTHYYSLMVGSDPLAFGFSWLSVGLCWYGGARGWWGLPVLMLGLSMASFAVRIKELALPPLALIPLYPMWVRSKRTAVLSLPFVLYSAYWGYAWMWPAQAHRLQTEVVLDSGSFTQGWNRLIALYERGIPQGKFDQLILLPALLLPFSRRNFKKYILWAAAALLLIGTAYMLQQRARPRYLASAALGSLLVLGFVLSTIRFHRAMLCAVCFLFIMDGWAYFDVWGEKRQQMVGGNAPRFPAAPSPWRRQYESMSDLTLRDLSLYGAISMVEKVQETDGIASMRLRDERHRSLLAFATLYDKGFVILDPGACCAGNPVDERCAQRTTRAVKEAGFTLLLPTDIKGIERIYPNEERWRTLLLQSVTQTEHDPTWISASPTATGGELPCQASIPFRNAK
ncbi:MAG: hypothetical protein VX278_02350 [Myxococcota bacterium]|nr:hypothetical protein [Myxococcota bacterium]